MTTRGLPVGAEVQAGGGVHCRVGAPRREWVHVALDRGASSELPAEGNGYFSGLVAAARAGTLYRFRLDAAGEFPDPASRFQPEGPHGPSRVVDPHAFAWTDGAWRGCSLEGQVIYEMHIGTFTRGATWPSAMGELGELAACGVTLLEVMPVAEFPGRFGWGYDGVDLYAPTRLYGEPDDFRAFVDRAHAAGLGVILDVVYNHFGPDGCYLGEFAGEYFTDRYQNDWGKAINFDGPDAGPVREFFVANAGYWIEEFHLDGLRLDATQQIFDASPLNLMQEIAARVRQAAHGERVHRIESPGRYRALAALMLLAPGTPMLFQGQEFAASSPFLYFADHQGQLATEVRKGRAEFLAQFRSIATREAQERLADPGDMKTFERCKLDLGERERHAEAYALHRDLMRLRREDAVFAAQGAVDGAVLGTEAFVLRFFGPAGDDRLLLVNLGRDLHLDAAPEPLLASAAGARWQLLWSSEDPRYGGGGTAAIETHEGWRLPGHAAVALRTHG